MTENKHCTTTYTSSMYDKQLNLTVILACFGEISSIKKPLRNTIRCLSGVKESISLIAVTDGAQYLQMPIIKKIKRQFPYVKIINMDEETHQPAKLMNVGLDQLDTQYVVFSWAGSHFDLAIQEFTKNPLMEFPVYAIKNTAACKIPLDPNPALIYSWFQCTRLYELNNLIVSKDAVKLLGNFDESPLLQKDFDWEWMLRLSKYFMFTPTGTAEANNALTFSNYPFNKSFSFSPDIIHRYLLRNKPQPYKSDTDDMSKAENDFFKDLPVEDIHQINQTFIQNGLNIYAKNTTSWFLHSNEHYKITIIGGYWEYHHNQLCFFNYLDKLYGKGFATYKVLLDTIADPEDVIGSDLVILSRSRTPKILDIIAQCKKDHIVSLYMIDDNWFTVANDLPDFYGDLFIPGNSQFDTFIKAIEKCDAVLTFNKLLYMDISKYNKNVILFHLNINLDFYSQDEETDHTKHNQDTIMIGYAGSLRHDDTAFIALSNVARKCSHVRVLLFGGLSQSQRLLFEGLDTIIQEHVPYPIYCKIINRLSPDILLAPLVSSRTSMSKCPNKYLETGAVTAAGIYSDIYPYNSVVKDGVNGLLVTDNTVSAWEEKILQLINDRHLLLKIKTLCRSDVEKHYSTEKLIKKFCKMIKTLVQKRKD